MMADLLSHFTETAAHVLGDNLVGIYLHGSAAMGCFNPAKSDLDLLLVVKEEIPDPVKMKFMDQVVIFHEKGPAKGMELSIVRREVCKPFVYPTPFELHFSQMHLPWFRKDPKDYIEKMKGTDPDLAAHVMILNHWGKVLFGEEIRDVFGPVSRQDYVDSIWQDVRNARGEIEKDPMYLSLNLCRVLAYLQEDLVLSKQAGGEWALHTLPQRFHPLIQSALQSYETEETMAEDLGTLQEFADSMLQRIEFYIS